MKSLPVFLGLGLLLPLGAQASHLALDEDFFVRLDSLHIAVPGRIIYDEGHDIDRPERWLIEHFGTGWFAGPERDTSMRANLTVHSEDGSLSFDKITDVSFHTEGCARCSYHWGGPSWVHRPEIEMTPDRIHLRAGSSVLDSGRSSGFSLSLYSDGALGDADMSTEAWGDALKTAFDAAGHEEDLVLPSIWDEFYRMSTSRTPFADMTAPDTSVSKLPLPAPVLFLLAATGVFAAMARHKRRLNAI